MLAQKKLHLVGLAALVALALPVAAHAATTPAAKPAATAPKPAPAPAVKTATAAKPMAAKPGHRATCWDAPWNSDEWKACEASGGKAPVQKAVAKKKPAAPVTKKM